MYCLTLSRQQTIFTSLGVQDWLNIRMQVFIWIHSLPFLMEILLKFVTPCFPRADAISSSVAMPTPDNSSGSV